MTVAGADVAFFGLLKPTGDSSEMTVSPRLSGVNLLSTRLFPAAIVNGTAITMAEVESILKQAGPTATPLTEAQRKQMQMEAVAMLIDDVLMEQFLKKNGRLWMMDCQPWKSYARNWLTFQRLLGQPLEN